MANSLTTEVLVDGPRNAVIKITGVLDTSNLAATVIADPSTMQGIDNTGFLKAASFQITGLDYSIQDGIAVVLYWDATTPVVAETLNGRGCLPPSRNRYGGIVNNAGAGKTGKILIATTGWTALVNFSLILELVKVQSGVIAAVPGTPDTTRQYADLAGTIPLVG